MRRDEAGFTLLELVVTVGILVILLAAGGVWMVGMRPGALRGALDDFDANLAAAKAVAATSGNGATLIFEPQTNGSPGYTLAVFSGRPTAAGAVTATNTMIGNSSATVSEAHFGNPPFAIFLSSAGYPTGKAGYPTLNSGAPNFTTIATQPPCPAGGIELTFTSPQGVTATRTLACNAVVAGAGGTDPTPSPNPIKVEPTYLLAHYTADSGPLKFEAVEYGYYHWYESHVGQNCQTQSSDTGAPPAVFASPWPYAQASPASQGAAAPAPPNTPYTWPVGDPNDPPARFQLSPVLHNGGICTLTVADDSGQVGAPVTVQVMGDLRGSPAPPNPLVLTVGQGPATINFGKTFDNQTLQLSLGDSPTSPCSRIITAQPRAASPPSSPTTASAGASVTVNPIAQGGCVMVVQDQYGEQLQVPINVAPSPTPTPQPGATWPQQLVIGNLGNAVGLTSGAAPVALNRSTRIELALGPVINALLGGSVARAYGPVGQLCNALGVTNGFTWGNNPSGYVDTSLPGWVSSALGVYVDANGCLVDINDNPLSTIGMIAYNPARAALSYNLNTAASTCNGTQAQLLGWETNPNAVEALFGASGNNAGTCSVVIVPTGETAAPVPDAGLITVNVLAPSYFSVECTGFIDQEGDRGCGVACEGDSVGCQGNGPGVQFLCAGSVLATDSSGLFTITTGEGTSQPEYSIGPNMNEEISTSSDGTAFISSGSC